MENPKEQGPSVEFEISEEIQSVTVSYQGAVYRVAITPFLTMWSRLITQVNKDNPGLTDADKKQLRQQLFTFYNENREVLESVITAIEDQQRREKMLADSDWENGSAEFKDIVEVRAVVAKTLAIPASEIQAREKYQTVVRAAYRHLHSNGVFYYDPSRKISYWFDDDSKILHDLSSETFESFLCDRLSLNREDIAFAWSLTGIRDRASIHGTKTEAKRLSFYDQEEGVLYWNNKPGRSLRIDGEKILEVNNGEGALFLWDDDWEEFDCPDVSKLEESRGALREHVYKNMIIDEMETSLTPDEASSVLDVYIQTVLFHDILEHRPVLALLGPWGCGKTTFAKLIGFVFFGKKFEVLGLEDEKQDAAIAYATSSAYGVFDNADEWIKWLPDLIARISTGSTIPKRVLYKTNELAKYPVDMVLALTARTTPWARPDVISRLLIFRMKQPPDFIDENVTRARVLGFRSAMIRDLARGALDTVKRLKQKKDESFGSPSRLAGFYNFALKMSDQPDLFKTGFQKILSMQGILASEEQESLISILFEWIKGEIEGVTVEGREKQWTSEKSTTQLYAELSQIAKNKNQDLGVRNATSLGRKVKSSQPFLKTSGILLRWRHVREGSLWSFGLTEEARKLLLEKPSQPSQPSPNVDLRTIQPQNGDRSEQGNPQPVTHLSPLPKQELSTIKPSVTDVTDVTVFSGKVSSIVEKPPHKNVTHGTSERPVDVFQGTWTKESDGVWMVHCNACKGSYSTDNPENLKKHQDENCPGLTCFKCQGNDGKDVHFGFIGSLQKHVDKGHNKEASV